jgi:transposase
VSCRSRLRFLTPPPKSRKLRIGSADPGIRTPTTVFDLGANTFLDVAPRFSRYVYRYLVIADQLQADPKASRRVRNVVLRRATSLVDDLHRQVGAWLARHYDVLLWGHMSVKDMMRKAKRRLHRKTVRRRCVCCIRAIVH